MLQAIIILVFLGLLEINYYYKCIEYLKKYECNTSLFKCIYKLVWFYELPRIEVSIKNSRVGRYTIPLRMNTFNKLSTIDKNKILNIIGFTDMSAVDDMSAEKSSLSDDIIFGLDGNIGKLYIDKSSVIYGTDTLGNNKTYTFNKEGQYYSVERSLQKDKIKILNTKETKGSERHYIVQNGLFATVDDPISCKTRIQTIYKRPQIPFTTILEIIRMAIHSIT